jgi:hypothetical protein
MDLYFDLQAIAPVWFLGVGIMIGVMVTASLGIILFGGDAKKT